MKVKVKYDKSLEKYHVYYDKVKDKKTFRYNLIKSLNTTSDLMIIIETHLGSLNAPDPTNYTRTLERALADRGIKYYVKPIQARAEKNIFGVLTKKKPIKDFSITYFLDKGSITMDLFEDLLCEYDLQFGYNFIKDRETIFDDIAKGYFDSRNPYDYYEKTMFDSMIFHKFLVTDEPDLNF